MEQANSGRVADDKEPMVPLYWYTSTNTDTPVYNKQYSMFKTGQEDMNKYFGIFYPFYEALCNSSNKFLNKD